MEALLPNQLIKLLLILLRSHAMPRHKGGARRFLPNCCVTVLAADRVSVDKGEAKALLPHQLIELLLVLLRCHAMPGDKLRATLLLPDRRIPILPANRIAADIDQAKSLMADQLI